MTETVLCPICYNVATHSGTDGFARCDEHKRFGDTSFTDTSDADKLLAELAAMRAERDATEAALRQFCVLAHENRGHLAAMGMMLALNKLGLWREPAGGESRG